MHSLKNRRNSAWKVAWPSGKVSNGATPLGVGSLRLDRTVARDLRAVRSCVGAMLCDIL